MICQENQINLEINIGNSELKIFNDFQKICHIT
jgi:hypothetical protein